MNGFTHKLPLLASRVLRALAGATFEGASWETVHEATCRKYRNMNMQARTARAERRGSPCSGTALWPIMCCEDASLCALRLSRVRAQVSKHASYERLHALCAAALHHTQLLPHAQAATLADVRAHVQQALQE